MKPSRGHTSSGSWRHVDGEIPKRCSSWPRPSIPIARGSGNLLDDPSFEVSKSKDQFGLVFARGEGGSTRVTATSGSARWLVPESTRCWRHRAKIRVTQNVELTPGRFRVTAYLRGLDIGKGTYNLTTEFIPSVEFDSSGFAKGSTTIAG